MDSDYEGTADEPNESDGPWIVEGWRTDVPHWGNWQFNERENTIDFIVDRNQRIYGVPVSELKTPNSAIGWIAHLHHKNWASPEVMGDFLLALEEIVNLQRLADTAPGLKCETATLEALMRGRAIRKELDAAARNFVELHG